jgi:hypothetical protein
VGCVRILYFGRAASARLEPRPMTTLPRRIAETLALGNRTADLAVALK